CYIGAGAVLRGDIGTVLVGHGSNIQENCVIHTFPDKNTNLHDNTHIGHGAILHGCEIFPDVLIGMGAIVADGVIINSRCLIGAGSFVPFGWEVPSDSVLAGSPAKIIKPLNSEQLEIIRNSRAIYQNLALRYLKSFREIPTGDALHT
ncbi:MAG: gamma carbonic anhydrase family protein, partial [Syntrophobacteraceae bacterium]|nr:gamma carbonic anhydrase family protein [Syntrophobacteraceae bacterium]